MYEHPFNLMRELTCTGCNLGDAFAIFFEGNGAGSSSCSPPMSSSSSSGPTELFFFGCADDFAAAGGGPLSLPEIFSNERLSDCARGE